MDRCCTDTITKGRMTLLVLPMILSMVGSTSSYDSNTEYDFGILDPLGASGSPYGGFSRATASRLANMPLRLPDFTQELTDFDPMYMNIRDAQGRGFACRVYHEDELEAESLHESMFDLAKVLSTDKKDDLDTNSNQQSEDSVEVNVEEEEVIEPRSLSKNDPVSVVSKRLNSRLQKLKGMCAQYHRGWWSYEWCYQDKISQFHIEIEKITAKSENIVVRDVTSLGVFQDRKIDYFLGEDNNLETRGSLAQVQDQYRWGATCPETKKPRMTRATLECCSQRKTIKNNHDHGSVLKDGQPVKSDLLSVMGVFEDEVCVYSIKVCTPLLCVDYEDDDQDTVPKKQNVGKKAIHPKNGNDGFGKAVINAEGMTVLEIVESVFGKFKCIQSGTGGWWVYELCPGRVVRQFHEVITIDTTSGVPRSHVEMEHILGKYNPDESKVAKEDEWKYVVNGTSTATLKSKGKVSSVTPPPAGGNGAYYFQEYIHGDVCDHEDVTDSAIKAGEFGEGDIERATTVRYFCGKQLEMTVKEDSTCHYIVDVTMPDLCGHPLFKAPVSKRQVVKCLPNV